MLALFVIKFPDCLPSYSPGFCLCTVQYRVGIWSRFFTFCVAFLIKLPLLSQLHFLDSVPLLIETWPKFFIFRVGNCGQITPPAEESNSSAAAAALLHKNNKRENSEKLRRQTPGPREFPASMPTARSEKVLGYPLG